MEDVESVKTRTIDVYQRKLSKLQISVETTGASRDGASPETGPLGQLMRKESRSHGNAPPPQTPTLLELYWKKLVCIPTCFLKNISPKAVARKAQRCYWACGDCCAAGLAYKGFTNPGGRPVRLHHHANDDEDVQAIHNFFQESLSAVRAARSFDCSTEQIGSPQGFSWEAELTTGSGGRFYHPAY